MAEFRESILRRLKFNNVSFRDCWYILTTFPPPQSLDLAPVRQELLKSRMAMAADQSINIETAKETLPQPKLPSPALLSLSEKILFFVILSVLCLVIYLIYMINRRMPNSAQDVESSRTRINLRRFRRSRNSDESGEAELNSRISTIGRSSSLESLHFEDLYGFPHHIQPRSRRGRVERNAGQRMSRRGEPSVMPPPSYSELEPPSYTEVVRWSEVKKRLEAEANLGDVTAERKKLHRCHSR